MDKKNRGYEKSLFTQIGKTNKLFTKLFHELLSSRIETWSNREKEYILSCAVLFFNHYDLNQRYKNFFRMGYYIILKYAIIFKDYKPLYDISLQIGFYPISDFILKHKLIESENLFEELINKFVSKRYRSYNNYVETYEQNITSKEILSDDVNDIVYIAPTSYGKSSLIKDIIRKFNYERIGIIVPTKSLLTQTYNDIKSLDLDYKIILHDEMYSNKYNKFIGVLTQERATRLLSKHQVSFDLLVVDEAHNLFKNDSRSIILSRLILLNHSKNNKQRVIYLSPLVDDSNNLRLRRINSNFVTKGINHDLKTFEVFYWKNNQVSIYNRFNNLYVSLSQNIDFWSYIHANSKNKNFIYLYRPKHIENFAKDLYKSLVPVEITEELYHVISTLKEEVHPSFYMISMLERGIIYLHAKMPTIIKEYLEVIFKKEPSIRYMIANNVILEGVNHPIDNLFIASTYAMHGKQLTNLIGRVNRLNEVFSGDKANLSRLVSSIHFIEHPDYSSDNMLNKIVLLRDYNFVDEIDNPLIESYNAGKKKTEKEENKDKEIVKTTDMILFSKEDTLYDRIVRYLLENDIISIYKEPSKVYSIIENNVKTFVFKEGIQIINIVCEIFIRDLDSYIYDDEISRLKNQAAVNYYNKYLNSIQKMSLNEKILITTKYFKNKAETKDPLLYIGSSYGECSKSTLTYKGGKNVYIDLAKKNESELVNLAIVKLKIEEDFINYKLVKLIQFLHDFNIISDDYYNQYMYGTTDENVINLVRQGLGVNVAKKILDDNQVENLYWDKNGNLKATKKFVQYMNGLAPLTKFELERFLI